ncbi:MAG: peptidoglycan DD-metalloendopeptidase family protein [Thermacetogeniaceae bacterium]
MKETWLVPGEGGWYPNQGTVRLGRLCDRYGQDVKLANQWGDAYAVVLYHAAQISDEDKMQDMGWVKSGLKDAAEKLRPWFYYKESYVEYCGKDGCERETVYLLVEAYTIRGHYQFHYQWVTESTGDGGSVTYEKLIDTVKLSDGLDYLEKYIVDLFDLPTRTDEEKEQAQIAARSTFEMAQGFTAQQENLAWLLDSGVTLASIISGAMIPAEFRDALEEASEKTGIPTWFLAGLIEKESSWNPNAVNENTGCFGLTQLNPKYWPEWARRYGFDPEKDKWDPRAQIIVGAYVLKGFLGNVSWDWDELNLKNPPAALKTALAKYGGYGTDVKAAEGYINDVLSKAAAYRSHPAVWPTPGYYEITSHFGMRYHPVLHIWRSHEGVDIGAPEGAEVVSVSGGVVAAAGKDCMGVAYGNAVLVRDAQYEYLYAHLSEIDVKAGDAVKPGDRIGLVGDTGWAKGAHLHFGVRPIGGDWIDPEPLLKDLQK